MDFTNIAKCGQVCISIHLFLHEHWPQYHPTPALDNAGSVDSTTGAKNDLTVLFSHSFPVEYSDQ